MVNPSMANMQMLNFNNILNVKDSRWLQLEVCREFQRNKCTRPDTECKFAHPPVNVEVQNGRVTACYDSIKGRCNREKPPCKYFHPPQHLKDQLLINGRNHLALKNAFMTQIQGLSPGTQLVHGTLPVPSSPYLAGIPTMANFNPYISSPVMTVGMTDVASPITGVVPQAVVPAQKVPRTDRLEAFPGMGVPYKRPAPDKSGVPAVYQPTGNAAYQQALMQQLGGQSYVPVSCEYGGGSSTTANLLALPPPIADGPSHSPPAIHNVASSSAHPETPSSSTSTSSTSSATAFSTHSYPPTTSSSASTSSSSTAVAISSTAGKASSLHVICSSASPLPATPVNVISYTGYALNKGIRPPNKPPATHFLTPNSLPTGIPAAYNPGAVPGGILPSAGIGMGVSPSGLGLHMPGALTFMSPQGVASGIGGLVHSGMHMVPTMSGMGPGTVPSMFSPQLMYSQYPASSVYLPQITALSNNPQLSWAQASEQPYKKLKTS